MGREHSPTLLIFISLPTLLHSTTEEFTMSESAHHAPAPVPQSAPIYKIVDISTVKRQGDTWLLNSQLT